MVKQSQTERSAINHLAAEGYYVVKSAGSFGLFDLVAWKDGQVRMIQVKKTQGPRADERQALINFPPIICSHCQGKVSTKEIWLYKTKKGIRSVPQIELLE